jgi:NAD(P)-dependent dehydrogenase (short-subunit alcohol dehydrogenase family)
MKSLEQQVMLVTGATNGLGKQLAHELVAAGATVLLQSTAAEPPRRTESQKSCLCTPGVPALPS